MSKFIKAQFEYMKNRFRYVINAAVNSLGDDIVIPKEDKIAFIMKGKAKIKEEMLMPDEDGSCSRYLSEFLKFFKYPKEDVIIAKNLKLGEEKTKLRADLGKQLEDLLDKYVLDIITAQEVIDAIKELEKKYKIS